MTIRTVVTISMICVATGGAAGQDSPKTPAKQLSMRLAADQATCYEDDVLPLRLVVRNDSDQRAEAGLVVEPFHERYFQIFYRRVPEAFVALKYPRAWQPMPDSSVTTVVLQPGEERQFPFSLAANPELGRFLFDREGEYEIKAVERLLWMQPPETIETPPLVVKVLPRSAADEARFKDLWDVKLAYLAQEDGAFGGPDARLQLGRALSLLRAYPQSTCCRSLRGGLLQILGGLDHSLSLTTEERQMIAEIRQQP